MPHVEMYTTHTCASCIRAKRLFESRGIKPHLIDVSMDRTPMVERSGRITVPQIYVNGTHVGGYDDLVVIARDGWLDTLLAQNEPGADEIAGDDASAQAEGGAA